MFHEKIIITLKIVLFDSTIGLLVFLNFPDKTGLKLKPVAGVYFKDYLKGGWLEADKAYFVIGSDIRDPWEFSFCRSTANWLLTISKSRQTARMSSIIK